MVAGVARHLRRAGVALLQPYAVFARGGDHPHGAAGMIYTVRHTTRYDYSETVPICYNRAHLSPRNDGRQRVIERRIAVTPPSAVLAAPRTDFFGNEVTYFAVQTPHNSLAVTLDAKVDAAPSAFIELDDSPAWETAAAAARAGADPTPY
ncbi:MAG: hypothetical protein FJY92_07105, partial [Candidatus Hydrogenedentes bacterium]|nr:hypothetical protein [Candidatus Hydrogenedentota bacterium]